MRCDVRTFWIVATWLWVALMPLTRTTTAYLVRNFGDDTVGTTVQNFTERSGAWSIVALSGDQNRLECAETTDNRICESDTAITSSGKRFVQVRMMHPSVSGFPGVLLRYAWNTGSINGYLFQIGPTGNGISLSVYSGGAKTPLHVPGPPNGNSLTGEDYIVQCYVADGVQNGYVIDTIGGSGVRLIGSDTTHDGQNTRGTAFRHGYSVLASPNTNYLHIIDTPDRILTVTGLPTGYSAQVANSVGTVMGTITAPDTTVNLMQSFGVATAEVELGGWVLRILDSTGQAIEQFASAVYPGDVFAYTETPTATIGDPYDEQILVRWRLRYEDPALSPSDREYIGASLTISELDGTLTENRGAEFGEVQYSSSDRSGGWQSTHARVLSADKLSDRDASPQLRGFLERITGRTLRNVEYILEMNSHKGILDGDNWFIIFRGKVERWSGPAGFKQRIEAIHWLQAALKKQVLSKLVGTFFPSAPVESRERLVPLLLGTESDEPSTTAAPVFIDDETGRGGHGEPDAVSSYGDIGLDAPTGLILVESLTVGGNLMLGDQRGNRYYVFAVHRYTSGLGDPEPFLDGELITISGDNSAIEAYCDASNDTDYVATRFYICTENTTGTVIASHYIETATPVAGVTFTDVPPLGTQGIGTITTGGVVAENPFAYVAALAVMSDGRTAPSNTGVVLSVGYRRPVRFVIDAISGALEYEFYWRDLPSGAFARKFTVHPSHLNDNGDPYWEYDWGASGFSYVDDIPTPVGVIPPIHCGKFTDDNGFSDWDGFLISGRPGSEFISAYIGGLRLEDGQYGVDIVAPGKTGWTLNFGANDYYTASGHKFFMVFLRGPVRDAAVEAAASASSGATLPATSATATIGTGDSELVVTVETPGDAGNAYTVQVVNGVGNNQPLTVTFTDPALLVTLATDGSGNPNNTANTALLVAQAISARSEFEAGVTNDGTDPVAEEGPVPFSGGADEGHLPGNPYFGEFRVNVSGLGSNSGTIGGGVADTVITDGYQLLGILLDNGPLIDPTITEENRLISASDLLAAPQNFSDGVPRRDTASWSTASGNATVVVPSGNTVARWLATAMTWEDLLREILPSLWALLVPRLNGSVGIAVTNPNASPSATLTTFETIRDSVEFDDSDEEYANAQPYAYGHHYDIDGSLSTTESATLEDTDSQERNDERLVAPELELTWRTSATMAQDVASMYLHERAYLQRLVPASSGIDWVNRTLGEIVDIDHPELPAPADLSAYDIRGLTISPDNLSAAILCLAQRRLPQPDAVPENEYMVSGRLSTESGVAISTSDRTLQSTLYWVPYHGNSIPFYVSSAWTRVGSAQMSLALSGLTSGANYDVFADYNGGTPQLVLGAAWTNDTTRSQALATQDGVYVKTGDTDHTYLGTIRTTSTTTTEDSGGGSTTQVGGKRFVWNLHNQVPRPLAVIDTTDNWSYATATIRQMNATSGNKVEWVTGIASLIDATSVQNVGAINQADTFALAGVGIDSTTVFAKLVSASVINGGTSDFRAIVNRYTGLVSVGYHYAAPLERGGGTGTITWLGDNGGGPQSGLTAVLNG